MKCIGLFGHRVTPSECDNPPRDPIMLHDPRIWCSNGITFVPKLVKTLQVASQQGCFPRAHTIHITQHEHVLAGISDTYPESYNGPEDLDKEQFSNYREWISAYAIYIERILLRDCLHDIAYVLP